MVEYRVTYVENESGKRCLKRWPTVEEARAFIVGLRRGAPVGDIKLAMAEDGQKLKPLPLREPMEAVG